MHLHLLILSMWSCACCLLISSSSETGAKFPVCTPFSSLLIWVMPSTFHEDVSPISLLTKIHVICFHGTWKCLSIHLCVCALWSLEKKKVEAPVRCLPRRAGCFWQAPPSPAYMAWIEHKANVSLLMVGQTTRQSRFFGEFITGLNQKLNFNTVPYEAFASRAWFPRSLVF